MNKKLLLTISLSSILLLSACGGGSSNSPKANTPDINKTVNKTKNEIPTCKKDGNNVLVPTATKKGQTTCKYNGWNATCDGSRVTLNKGGSNLTAKSINLNGTRYICE